MILVKFKVTENWRFPDIYKCAKNMTYVYRAVMDHSMSDHKAFHVTVMVWTMTAGSK